MQGHCLRSRDELISDVLLWTPTYGRTKAGRPSRTYIQQLCEDTGCSPKDLPEAMNDREKWRERRSGISVLAARQDDDDIYCISYMYILYVYLRKDPPSPKKTKKTNKDLDCAFKFDYEFTRWALSFKLFIDHIKNKLLINDVLGFSGGVRVSKVDKQAFTSEFESHQVPHY